MEKLLNSLEGHLRRSLSVTPPEIVRNSIESGRSGEILSPPDRGAESGTAAAWRPSDAVPHDRTVMRRSLWRRCCRNQRRE